MYYYIKQTASHINYNSSSEQSQNLSFLQKENETLRVQITSLKLQIAELKRIIFGSKKETFIMPDNNQVIQPKLFAEAQPVSLQTQVIAQVKGYEKKKTTAHVNHPGRNPLPEHLRRETIEIKPQEDVEGLMPVGNEITEVLEYKPGELYVKQYIRPEYIKPTEDGLNAKRIIAPLPAMPIDKAIVGASLLSHLMVSKFVDHLPIYRKLEIFKRQNVNVDYTTASGWIKQGSNLIKPLYDLHCKSILQADYLGASQIVALMLFVSNYCF